MTVKARLEKVPGVKIIAKNGKMVVSLSESKTLAIVTACDKPTHKKMKQEIRNIKDAITRLERMIGN